MSMLTINFEFVGGPNDGKVLRGLLGDASDAERYYLFTNHGHIGQRFKVASDFAVEALAQEHSSDGATRLSFQPHHYVVTERLEEDDEVLVRAAYVENEPEPSSKDVLRDQSRHATVEVESSEEKIWRYLKQTATVMGQSYGQCWPSDAADSQEATKLNISLHFAHVLLNEQFSVFAKANHSDKSVQAIDLLGISPGQDWFLACEFTHLFDASQLGAMLLDVTRLETFWLNRRLAIDASGEHIARVAKHCESGYGLAAGLHWVPESHEATELLNCWTTRETSAQVFDQFAGKLNSLNAVWLPPISVKHYEGQGTYCLLATFFRIPRSRP